MDPKKFLDEANLKEFFVPTLEEADEDTLDQYELDELLDQLNYPHFT